MSEVKSAPKKRTRPPGTHSLHVTLTDALYAKIEATADGRPVNMWLARIIERNAHNLPELRAQKTISEE